MAGSPISPAKRPARVTVRTLSRLHAHGVVIVGGQAFRCALGRGGLKVVKREGDGATPIGSWPVRRLFYRADRGPRPPGQVPCQPLHAAHGWCDAPDDRNYNRLVTHPYPASAERMWRADHLYDVVLVIGHNDRPRRRGAGSAIFVHLARDGYQPTEGCIALSRRDMHLLVGRLGRGSRVDILA